MTVWPVWVYYETDGDSGWYRVKVFSTMEKAEAYKRKRDSAYGHVSVMTME